MQCSISFPVKHHIDFGFGKHRGVEREREEDIGSVIYFRLFFFLAWLKICTSAAGCYGEEDLGKHLDSPLLSPLVWLETTSPKKWPALSSNDFSHLSKYSLLCPLQHSPSPSSQLLFIMHVLPLSMRQGANQLHGQPWKGVLLYFS